ncbi:MAG: peptidoglycan editing factor PgeF [Rhodocyclaceae bacterium]|nr:peptidoglycan editing factor PgeF [Rhodocyclaceae bacterium]
MDDWLAPDWPAPPSVRAGVTTRGGGHSTGAHRGFNLATHVGDDPVAVAANRECLRCQLPVEPLWLTQVHGTRCVVAEESWTGIEADACVTRSHRHVCVVMTADCLPVFLCNRSGTTVGVAHAGWRGLASGVLEASIMAMGEPGDQLLAWLGPAIGPNAFEVGDDVREVFVTADAETAEAFVTGAPGKWWCDIYSLARRRLFRAGLTDVHGGGLCTVSDASRFYSYRRDGVTGRMASLIWLQA